MSTKSNSEKRPHRRVTAQCRELIINVMVQHPQWTNGDVAILTGCSPQNISLIAQDGRVKNARTQHQAGVDRELLDYCLPLFQGGLHSVSKIVELARKDFGAASQSRIESLLRDRLGAREFDRIRRQRRVDVQRSRLGPIAAVLNGMSFREAAQKFNKSVGTIHWGIENSPLPPELRRLADDRVFRKHQSASQPVNESPTVVEPPAPGRRQPLDSFDPTDHHMVSAMLAELGMKLGFRVFIAVADVDRVASHLQVTDGIDIEYRMNSGRADFIDVCWLDASSRSSGPVAAFEVETTTMFTAALGRFHDLERGFPRVRIEKVLVCPNERLHLAKRELRRALADPLKNLWVCNADRIFELNRTPGIENWKLDSVFAALNVSGCHETEDPATKAA